MSAADAEWHMIHNKQAWQAAFDEEQRRRSSKLHVAQTRTKLQWQGHASESEDEAARIAGATFAKKFPQFERSLSNAQAMARYMQENDLPGTELSSYIAAFRALSERGELTSVKPESSTEFLQKHPELRDTRTPPMIAVRNATAEATEAAFANAELNTVRAGSTSVTTYDEEQTGFPQAPTKYSFRKLLDSLSADEYQRRVSEDPQFAAAIDRLNNDGNR